MYRSPTRVALLGLLALTSLPPAAATNFLVVYLDDLGADKVSAYAADLYPAESAPTYLPDTPAIDELAAAGLRFTAAYAQPLCSPSRASLLTGRWPFQHDVSTVITNTTPVLATGETTLAELLAAVEGGPYTSALFGKWHLGSASDGGTNWRTAGDYADAPNPARHGFVAYRGNLEGQIADYYSWTEVRWPVTISSGGTGSTVRTSTSWASDRPVADAADWIAEQPGSWLAIVSFNAPHLDGEGAADTWETDDLAPESGGECRQRDADAACNSKENYASLVEDVDARVGTLLDELAATDPALLEDTVILLLGDNGTPASLLEAPWTPSGERTVGGKNSAYESGLRVPFVITLGCDWMDQQDGALDGRYADGEPACTGADLEVATPGLAIAAPAQIEDVYATFAALAGAPGALPEASADLSPCLAATPETAADCGVPSLGDRAIYGERFTRPYTEASGYGTTGPATQGAGGLRRGDLKIVVGTSTLNRAACTTYELYDLAADPYETNNLLVGDTLSTDQSAAWTDLWVHLRTVVAPDWLPTQNCVAGSPWDADGDRYEANAHGGVDCDDTDATTYPGATDTWYDGVDANCDGADDYDKDADGYPSSTYGGTDCRDESPSVHPGAEEACNAADDDCDGAIDEGVASTWYPDTDGDGYGDDALAASACSQPADHIATGGDCDDTSAAISPAAVEVCDGIDQDCDGAPDDGVLATWYRDQDKDTYGASTTTTTACTQPTGYVADATDCNDKKANVRPGATEVCNAVDDDCDGTVDEGVLTTWYIDADNDGVGSTAATTTACTRPTGYARTSTDCNDANAAIKPGARETKNDGIDSNCNGSDNS